MPGQQVVTYVVTSQQTTVEWTLTQSVIIFDDVPSVFNKKKDTNQANENERKVYTSIINKYTRNAFINIAMSSQHEFFTIIYIRTYRLY